MPNENPNEGESNLLDALLKARDELKIPTEIVGKDGERLRAAQKKFREELNISLARFDYIDGLPQDLFGRDGLSGKTNMNEGLDIEQMLRGIDALIDKMSKKEKPEIYYMPITTNIRQFHSNVQNVFHPKKKNYPSSKKTIDVNSTPTQGESGSTTQDIPKAGEATKSAENASRTPQEAGAATGTTAATTPTPENTQTEERLQAFGAKRFEMWLQKEGRFSPAWKWIKGTFVDFEKWANDWWEFIAKTQLGQWLDAFTGIAEPKHKNFLLSNKKNKK